MEDSDRCDELQDFIDTLVQEAQQLNIETKPKEEIDSLLSQWH